MSVYVGDKWEKDRLEEVQPKPSEEFSGMPDFSGLVSGGIVSGRGSQQSTAKRKTENIVTKQTYDNSFMTVSEQVPDPIPTNPDRVKTVNTDL